MVVNVFQTYKTTKDLHRYPYEISNGHIHKLESSRHYQATTIQTPQPTHDMGAISIIGEVPREMIPSFNIRNKRSPPNVPIWTCGLWQTTMLGEDGSASKPGYSI